MVESVNAHHESEREIHTQSRWTAGAYERQSDSDTGQQFKTHSYVHQYLYGNHKSGAVADYRAGKIMAFFSCVYDSQYDERESGEQ